jgi:hypothetical protein
MAKFVLTAELVMVASNDLKTYCSQAELQITVADEDVTNYASLGWHERLGGLKDAKLVLNLYNDFAASALDSIMWPLLGTVATFTVAGTQNAVGTSNPYYSGSVLITDWNPITGKVGDVDTVSVTWPTTGAITRATS